MTVLGFALRGCLALALAATLDALCGVASALANGSTPPPALQSWRDLRRLARTQALLPEGASALLRFAPPAMAAATLAAAMLTPSFAAGAPGDLLAVAGLLGMAGLAHALALADGGAASGGVAAARGLVAGALAWPAVIALALVGELAGGGDLAATLLAMCAGTALAFASSGDGARDADTRVWSGMDLALVRASASLRTVTILTALTSLFPFGRGVSGDPSSWPLGVASWAIEVLSVGVAFTLLRATLRVDARAMLGAATILGALALLALLARQVSA